ncbi:MAG: tRNA lysidine(34) synthetase TilS [Lachnospiraceae bacterium]|nr:tRNA lysidine(34) synthetase TilS [Lachnospiraceae bacterium]
MKTRAAVKDLSSFIFREKILQKKDRVIAAVSGGADSCFLLRMLALLKEDMELELRAVHIHHGLRQSADRDEAFTLKLCRELDIPCRSVHVDAARTAEELGMGTEEAGRLLRYEEFEKAALEWEREEPGPMVLTALAHHRDDQAETVLFHLCRGSSLTGLAGMQPRSGRIIRPLLNFSRERIEEVLAEMGQAYCVDETNADPVYARNRIRNEILPLLGSSVNDRVSLHLARTAEDVREAEDYLAAETEKALNGCAADESDTGCLSIDRLRQLHPYLRSRVIYECIALAAGRKKDITRSHVEAVEKLVLADKNGSADLPYGIRAVKSYDRLRMMLRTGDGKDTSKDLSEAFVMKVMPYRMADDGGRGIPCGLYTKWFDYDKIGQLPCVRTRKSGDTIGIGGGHSKSLKKDMIDCRIPAGIRDSMPVICRESEVLWVPGFRMNPDYMVTDSTTRVLEIEWNGEL